MNEVRLIDANALIEAINNKKVVGRFNTIKLIENSPTISLEKALMNKLNDDKHEHFIMPPSMSMVDVVRAANRSCDNTTHCIVCGYYDFCNSLQAAYREVQTACDHNQQLKSFIVDSINNDNTVGDEE